jgi:uncharacterized protein involved in exopolysaccharide biosynthesis
MQRDDMEDKIGEWIDLNELASILWLNKKFIVILTGIFAILSIVYSLSLTNIYTSNALMVPTASNVNKPAMDFSVPSFAGFNLNSSPDVNVALAFIDSKKIIKQLMKHESFLPDLMAAKEWDKKSNSIVYNENIYDNKNKKWIREVNFPFQKVPSEQEAFLLFSSKINVTSNKTNQLITLTVNHISPSVAQQWAIWIINEANSMVANLRVEEAESSISYLNDQIMHTPYAELKKMFFNLIQQNTQNMMLAKVNKQYALTIIDPPLIPEFKSKPKRSLICILGTLLGCMLSVLIIIIRKYGFSKDDELDIFRLR